MFYLIQRNNCPFDFYAYYKNIVLLAIVASYNQKYKACKIELNSAVKNIKKYQMDDSQSDIQLVSLNSNKILLKYNC